MRPCRAALSPSVALSGEARTPAAQITVPEGIASPLLSWIRLPS